MKPCSHLRGSAGSEETSPWASTLCTIATTDSRLGRGQPRVPEFEFVHQVLATVAGHHVEEHERPSDDASLTASIT